MNEELQIVFQAVIRVFNYVKNSPFGGRHVAKSCDDMKEDHTLVGSCQSAWQCISTKI